MPRRKKRNDPPLSLFSFQDIMACLTGILIMVSLLLAFDGLSDTMQATPGKAAPQDASTSAAERILQLNQQIAILRRTFDERKGGVDVTRQEADVLDDRVRQMAKLAERSEARVTAIDAEIARLRTEEAQAQAKQQAVQEQVTRLQEEQRAQALRDRVRFRPGQPYPKAPVFIETSANALVVGDLDDQKTPRRIATLVGADASQRLLPALGPRTPANSFLVFVVHEDAIAQFEALRNALFRNGYEVGWQLWDGDSGGFFDGAPPAPSTPPGGGAP